MTIKTPYVARHFAGHNKCYRDRIKAESERDIRAELTLYDKTQEMAFNRWVEGVTAGRGREAAREYREFWEGA